MAGVTTLLLGLAWGDERLGDRRNNLVGDVQWPLHGGRGHILAGKAPRKVSP